MWERRVFSAAPQYNSFNTMIIGEAQYHFLIIGEDVAADSLEHTGSRGRWCGHAARIPAAPARSSWPRSPAALPSSRSRPCSGSVRPCSASEQAPVRIWTGLLGADLAENLRDATSTGHQCELEYPTVHGTSWRGRSTCAQEGNFRRLECR